MSRPELSKLECRITDQLSCRVDPAVSAFAKMLGQEAGALAVLFYGSNLRTGSLEGVLDFYVLLPGQQRERIWPRVSYHERAIGGVKLRAKVATMAMGTFAMAASGHLRDTTIWARFVQPSTLAWERDEDARRAVVDAVVAAVKTAARLAVALGTPSGTEEEYWRSLFRATYKAEFRVEKTGRENDILAVNKEHFAGLLPYALEAQGIAHVQDGDRITPGLTARQRRQTKVWWQSRRRLGKPFNFVRLIKATVTFEGAAHYAAWKIERHTGMRVKVTPFREKHPLLAAPGVLWALRRYRRRRS